VKSSGSSPNEDRNLSLRALVIDVLQRQTLVIFNINLSFGLFDHDLQLVQDALVDVPPNVGDFAGVVPQANSEHFFGSNSQALVGTPLVLCLPSRSCIILSLHGGITVR
jgi:hypothetical protein